MNKYENSIEAEKSRILEIINREYISIEENDFVTGWNSCIEKLNAILGVSTQ